jgi:predicted MPP superfamily phosphohydrolase
MDKPPLTRRQLFARAFGAFAAAAMGTAFYSYGVEPRWIREKKYDLLSEKWPKGHEALTIAAAGDFHVGCPSIGPAEFDSIVNRLNAVHADIIFLLGDFLIGGVPGGRYTQPQSIAEKLSKLYAPLGVYAVLGNHDWWEDGEGMWDALESAGIKVLENSVLKVKRPQGDIWIAGLADDTTRKPDVRGTLEQVTDDLPVIMLTHDPATFLEMPDRPVVTLAGHTHGGQVAFPLIGPLMIPERAPIKYAYGHINENERHLIVTSGLGTSILPVRFGRRPEIMKITVKASA